MIIRIIRHACCALLMFIFGCSNVLEPRDAGPYYAPLSLCCDTPKQAQLAQPIILRVEVANLLNVPSRLGMSGENDTFLISLYRDGEEVGMTDFGKESQYNARLFNWTVERNRTTIQYLGRSESLSPFGGMSYEIDLSRSFKIDKPGQYTVVVRRNIDIIRSGVIIGGMAKFAVVPES